jgi:hypothetical protein
VPLGLVLVPERGQLFPLGELHRLIIQMYNENAG